MTHLADHFLDVLSRKIRKYETRHERSFTNRGMIILVRSIWTMKNKFTIIVLFLLEVGAIRGFYINSAVANSYGNTSPLI